MLPLQRLVSLLLVLPPMVISSANEFDHYDSDCNQDRIPLDDLIHGNKRKYRIAVHAIRGFESALQYYNLTFEAYLTATAGQRFDPPIEFELVPVTFDELSEAATEETVDFIYANPGSYSCIGVENGAQPLVTTISKVFVRGHEYDLDVFGGVIFTRADNNEINNIHDLKDKVIGAGAISVIMGGQTQMYEMVKAGMDYVMDPKQVVFTGNQFDVVAGVLNGEFDVGMVRTDQIERSVDEDGNSIDDMFKILEPKIKVLDDGTLFPFLHSTEVFPEWPVASLQSVPWDVSIEVQHALYAISHHAEPWKQMLKCLEDVGSSTSNQTILDATVCDAVFYRQVTLCDTTAEVAQLAYQASQTGNIAGFRPPKSYFGVRTMHERAGFLLQDEQTGKWSCIRPNSWQESLACPPDHYKLSVEDFDRSCGKAGLSCHEGYDCYCKPCVKAFEVDVFQYFPEADAGLTNTTDKQRGCEKMSLCGTMEQGQTVFLRAIDNQKRDHASVTALLHQGTMTYEIEVRQVTDYTYQLQWTEVELGVVILELFVDGIQIPESPFRIQVIPRSCLEYGGNHRRVPDEKGNCVCADGHVTVGDSCVTYTSLAILVSLGAVVVVLVVGYWFVQHKNYKSDLVWRVSADELRFDDPVEVVGEGGFGVILLAEYRGTKVAIKRAVRAVGSGSSHGFGRNRHAHSFQSIQSTNEESDSDDNSAGSKGILSSVADSFVTMGGPGSTSLGQWKRTRGNNKAKFTGKKSSADMDLAFLADAFGQRTKGTNARFEEALRVGVDGTEVSFAGRAFSSETYASMFCPWADEAGERHKEFVQEMRLLSSLRHPCICTVMGAVVVRGYPPCLVMEYMEYGSLDDLLRNETTLLSGEIILQIIRDVAQGLRYLHDAKPPILHGDLKPANILIDDRFRAKVCDFGLSRKKKKAISGSLYWLPPEYLTGNEEYSPACDMYSIGIVINEIYSREKPYAEEDSDVKSLLLEICDRRVNKRPVMAETIPPKMSALVKKLWSRDPAKRPPAKELDTLLMDMHGHDGEPLNPDQLNQPKVSLYELFPKHIADALQAGKKVEPESHELVSIVFSDIKGFTDISRQISPINVSMMLDRLYLAFDKIASKHGVFKVETIGDAYMGVTNLVENQEDTHAKLIAEFAVDMIGEASQILIDEDEPNKGYINIRVGFHSGPVVANVIGSLNPRYGLFGDTVNTASRMESNSSGSRILCSESSYKLLKRQAPDMPVRARGKIPVKGKGEMSVFWVGDKLIRRNKHKMNGFRLDAISKSTRQQIRCLSEDGSDDIMGDTMSESFNLQQPVEPSAVTDVTADMMMEKGGGGGGGGNEQEQAPAAPVAEVKTAEASRRRTSIRRMF